MLTVRLFGGFAVHYDGAWVEAKSPEKKTEQEDSFGPAVFDKGDRIAAKVTNNHDEPVYVSILDFGLTGAISLLFDMAYTGDNAREARRNRVPPVEEWTTIERTFYLQ